ncbi:MAG: DUF2948 family protein [Marinovum sp.]|jgi:hypothetical protein|nr:DUF2948 family protein [Marinovum sp.]MDG1423983.1 DUF2948 family protein [Paracoccaceae bacterium]MBT6098069.1 DUF2948 family protein [Marinovum sp.]MBT6508150.1 DUF2948 family protein [Marinovum sp.]MBT6532425.1 DUF2948 family protein [Marinovum sp.]
MTTDAKFEDGGEAPLNIGALDSEDLTVISAMVQDAVLPIGEISWQANQRRLALLINRFRWEDKTNAERQGRPVERVQSLLAFDTVLSVASQGLDRSQKDLVLSVLSITMENAENGDCYLTVTLAGDGALRIRVEAVEVHLRDVTRPYAAPSRKSPHHPD